MDIELIEGDALYRRVIQDTLLAAKESAWIATANVKDCQIELEGQFRSIVDVFDSMCSRGVEVRLLHAGIPSASFLDSLKHSELLSRPGFGMRRCPRLHFKAVLVDDRLVHLGSANLTGAGLGAKASSRRNFELGILTDDRDLIDRVARLFHEIWEGLHCQECGRKDVCYVPLEEPG
jgi:phosphatidylserine/phosphatidylglycerophosphate/cardiolipin synthase-like enzyme